LLGVRILQFLHDVRDASAEDGQDFVAIDSVYEHFTSLGIHPTTVSIWLAQLLDKGLVLNYDPSVKELSGSSRIEASPAGEIHLAWATLDLDYIQSMKDITPLREKDVCDTIISSYSDFKNKWREAVRVFVEYLISEDELYCVIPDHPNFTGQLYVTKRLKRFIKQQLSTDRYE
jgi:hypothetical protein